MRRASGSIVANPVLVGAVTVLVVTVAVFLAYNANNGLPFVPTYQLRADLPSAANLVVGNEVRVAGARVGTVTDIVPVTNRATGAVRARLTLKLERRLAPLPLDSKLIVRSRSALGLKYVALKPGRSTHGFRDGTTIPVRNATPRPVEIDQVFNTFDSRTRRASRVNLREFGNALAGRGADLNVAIGELGPLLSVITPVARNLAAPATRFGRLFVALDRTANALEPVARQQAAFFTNASTTFGALSDVRPSLRETISTGAPALRSGIRGLPPARRLVDATGGLLRDLDPGVRSLSTAAPTLERALADGTPTLLRTVALSRRLGDVMGALSRFGGDPLVPVSLRELGLTAASGRPIVATLTPVQTVCNYVTLWFRNVSDVLSEGDANGTWEHFVVVIAPSGPNNEGGGSDKPANGFQAPGGRAASRQLPAVGTPVPVGVNPQANFLHQNPYPNTAQPGEPRECEAGNERYAAGRQVLDGPAGSQGLATDLTKRDAGVAP